MRPQNPAVTGLRIEAVKDFPQALNPRAEERTALHVGVGDGVHDADPSVPTDVPCEDVASVNHPARGPAVRKSRETDWTPETPQGPAPSPSGSFSARHIRAVPHL